MAVFNTLIFIPRAESPKVKFSVAVDANYAIEIDKKWTTGEDFIVEDYLGRRHQVLRSEYTSIEFGGMFIKD